MSLNRLSWHNDHTQNWGDDLNPYLYEKITGKVPDFVHLNENVKKHMMIGSILGVAKSNSIVWGSGAMFANDSLPRGVDVRAVRGPLSRKIVMSSGIKCPEVYGDPALLMSRYYQPKIEKKYKLGIIPHYVDKQLVRIPEESKDVLIINIGCGIENLVDHVLSCEHIISSSLHGLIVADAYDVPNGWVEFSNNISGSGYKFQDYLMSVGVKPYTPLNLKSAGILNINSIIDSIPSYDVDIDLDKLMDSCPSDRQV